MQNEEDANIANILSSSSTRAHYKQQYIINAIFKTKQKQRKNSNA